MANTIGKAAKGTAGGGGGGGVGGNCVVHVPMWLIRIPSAVLVRVLLSHSQLNARYVLPLQVTVYWMYSHLPIQIQRQAVI